jgi:glycosyltransferase involved in cell wall biosynthesis
MFKELLGSGLKGWTLHLAGTVRAETYLEEAKRQAAGLPVEFHIDASRKELEEIYGRSSIYWHATGAGADPELEPESMEHFGISTGEAMSAGCVPVVINRGGQPEITGSGGAGILWDSFDECIRETLKLAQDQSRLKEMSSSAIERAKLFSFPVFARRTKEIFDYK